MELPEIDIEKFDEEQHEWLMRQDLELYAIFCLAHLITPRWPLRRSDMPRWGALKGAIVRGALVASHDHRPKGLDYAAMVTLHSFLRFLAKADAEFYWLQSLGPRWQSRSTASFDPIQEDLGKDGVSRRDYSPEEIAEISRRYRDERAGLIPFPTLVKDKEWFGAEYPDLPRWIWRDTIRADLAPDEAKKHGPRGKAK